MKLNKISYKPLQNHHFLMVFTIVHLYRPKNVCERWFTDLYRGKISQKSLRYTISKQIPYLDSQNHLKFRLKRSLLVPTWLLCIAQTHTTSEKYQLCAMQVLTPLLMTVTPKTPKNPKTFQKFTFWLQYEITLKK